MTTADAARHRVGKVLVVAMHTRPQFRGPLEDAIAGDLRAEGVGVVVAHAVIPGPRQVTRERLKQEAERNGCDAVLIAGVVKRENVEVMDPGMAVGDRGDFRAGYPALSYESYQDPEESVEHEIVIEAKVFDADRQDLLWVARGEATLMADPAPQIPQLAQAITDRMRQDGLIPVSRKAT